MRQETCWFLIKVVDFMIQKGAEGHFPVQRVAAFVQRLDEAAVKEYVSANKIYHCTLAEEEICLLVLEHRSSTAVNFCFGRMSF